MQRDVFADIRDAILGAPTNVHRLQQLSGARPEGLHEETTTDLLLNEMVGRHYEISSDCPQCRTADCASWSSALPPKPQQVYAKPLSRYEEGGNKKHGVTPAAADWILEFKEPDASTRMMFQAKADRLPYKSEDAQLNDLVAAAKRYNAVPLYVIYIRHPQPHTKLTTLCPYRTSAADTSMLVLSAQKVKTLNRSKPVAHWSRYTRPLSCLAGCPCLGTSRSEIFAAALIFARSHNSKYQPGSEYSVDLPPEMTGLSVDTRFRSLSRSSKTTANDKRDGVDALFIVRAGTPRVDWSYPDTSDGRTSRRIGSHTDFSSEEWREATRKFWRASASRAVDVRYLIAAQHGRVRRIYRVIQPDGVIQHPDMGRIEFNVKELEESESRLFSRIKEVAEAKLSELGKGRTPFTYADFSEFRTRS